MTESIEPHFRTPRTQSEAGIDWMAWQGTKPIRPIYKDVLAAIGLTLSVAILYLLATVM